MEKELLKIIERLIDHIIKSSDSASQVECLNNTLAILMGQNR